MLKRQSGKYEDMTKTVKWQDAEKQRERGTKMEESRIVQRGWRGEGEGEGSGEEDGYD